MLHENPRGYISRTIKLYFYKRKPVFTNSNAFSCYLEIMFDKSRFTHTTLAFAIQCDGLITSDLHGLLA